MSAKVKKELSQKQKDALAKGRDDNRKLRQGIDKSDGTSLILLTHAPRKGAKNPTPGTFSTVSSLKEANGGYKDKRGKWHDSNNKYIVRKTVHVIPKTNQEKEDTAAASARLKAAWAKRGTGKGAKLTKADFN